MKRQRIFHDLAYNKCLDGSMGSNDPLLVSSSVVGPVAQGIVILIVVSRDIDSLAKG